MSELADTYEVVDARFQRRFGDMRLEALSTGCRWAEGPVYVPAGRYLLWSDIPNDRVLRWDERTGQVGVFESDARYSNGHTMDRQGRVLSCQHGERRIIRTEHDGSQTVVADQWNGHRLNSPNDVVVRSDDSIWFTDASYGIDSDYEGHTSESELDGCFVFRVCDGVVEIVADDFLRPTGIAFSPDESTLYVSDSRANHIRAFRTAADGALAGGEVFATNRAQSFDGMRVDHEGRIWIAASDGVQCFHPDGTLLGCLRTPESAANVEFGGPKGNRLFICAATSLYSIMLGTSGATTRRGRELFDRAAPPVRSG